MFEKESETYALSNFGFRGKNSQRVLTAKIDYQQGAEFGYNKAKDEMQEPGLALQSDMDKTIEQNIALKKELEKTNEWHYVEDGDLPNNQRIVEVFTKDKDIFIAYIDSEGEEWYVGQYFRKVLSMDYVIAWRDFVYPELPKEI